MDSQKAKHRAAAGAIPALSDRMLGGICLASKSCNGCEELIMVGEVEVEAVSFDGQRKLHFHHGCAIAIRELTTGRPRCS